MTSTTLTTPRLARIFSHLSKTYPRAHIVLEHWKTPWELLVAVILSAQCTDKRVNIVTKKLFATYRKLEDYAKADVPQLERDIRSTGFYHNKAKNIIAAAKLILEKFKGTVPRTMVEMLTIPGVARKTANVVLGNAYGVVEGIAVDTHVLRLSQRLRLVNLQTIGGKRVLRFERGDEAVVDFRKDADPVKIEQQLMQAFPKKDWFKLTYLLIDHGRAVCKAQRPNCGTCPLRAYCPASRI
jgi:endonuclease-3